MRPCNKRSIRCDNAPAKLRNHAKRRARTGRIDGVGPSTGPAVGGDRLTCGARRPRLSAVPIRVGIDLVAADSVEDSLRAAHGDRYLQRVYTKREIDDCATAAGIDPERLAARFAAKEATLKVLPVGNEGLALTAIEVRREPSGRVHIELSGRAAELAADAGVAELSASLTHEAGFAAAVVIAELHEAGARSPRSV
jgi:holo-[acyl-carrier protein] synthase